MKGRASSEQLTRLRVRGVDCRSCSLKIERTLSGNGIIYDFDHITSVINLREKDISRTLKLIRKISPGASLERDLESDTPVREKDIRKRLLLVILSAALIVASMILETSLPPSIGWITAPVLIGSYLFAGSRVLLKTFRNLLAGKFFDENSLMTIATLSAFAIGKPLEAVVVMLFYSVGELFQRTAINSSKKAIESLAQSLPENANLLVGGKTVQVKAEEISVGNTLLVRAGERIPVDGKVIDGRAKIDLSSLTGESVPVDVETGDELLSGSVNKEGVLTMTAERSYADSAFQRIVALTTAASRNKSITEKTLTKFARVYTPLVILTAATIATIPTVFFGAPILEWIYRALILLVISCPCAMLISVPLTYFSGIGALSRRGILVKGAHAIEAASRVSEVVFDKTGTLTEGELSVSNINNLDGYSDEVLLDIVVLAAAHSNHPIAQAIGRLSPSDPQTERISAYHENPGFGIIASIDDKRVVMGNARHLEREGMSYRAIQHDNTTVFVAIEDRIAASIEFVDRIKKDSGASVKALRSLGINEITMLTGDKRTVADRVARDLGVDRVYAEVLPQDKLAIIEKLHRADRQSRKGNVMFVGDGINDAPSIIRSDVGVAMGGLGSDAAIEASDVVIADDRPSKIVTVISHSRKVRSIVLHNILFALGAKAVFLVLGVIGVATMWQAIFADVGVTLLTILNAVRAFRINS